MVEIALLLTGFALLALYFLPTFVAGVRDHHASVGILALNLLLGWTGIFWLVALFWAFGRIRRDEEDEEAWEEEDEAPDEDLAGDASPEEEEEGLEEEGDFDGPPPRGRW
jgi:hypothetical protein